MMIARIEMLIRKSLDTPAASDFVYRNKVYVAARRAWRDNARKREIPEDRIDAFLREIEHCIENIELEYQLGPTPIPQLPQTPPAQPTVQSPVQQNVRQQAPPQQNSGKRLGPFADPRARPETRPDSRDREAVRIPPPARKRWKLLLREKMAIAALLVLSVSAAVLVLLR